MAVVVGQRRTAGVAEARARTVGVEAAEAGAGAELAREVVADDHDARFDLHLADRNVERADQATDVVEAVGGVLQQQRVGAFVDRDRAALGQQAAGAALRLDQRGEIGGLRVVDLQVFGAQRREFLHVLARGELGLLTRREFFGRRHDDDVVVAALVEALGAQHDVQRLVPRHVLQAQRDAALNRVGDDDVLAAGVREQLQHRAGFDVLEVQREALAGVDALLFGLLRRLAGRLHFDDVLVVGLVGELFEVAGGADGEAHAVADANHVEAGNRRGEIAGVIATRQVAGHFGAGKVHDDLVAELTQAGGRARIGQAHDHAAGAAGAAAEIDAADGARARRARPKRCAARQASRRRRWRRRRRRPASAPRHRSTR